MIKRNKIFLILIITLLVLVCGKETKADFVTPADSGFTYLFHLFYDGNTLTVDKDVKFKYDIIAEPYVPPILKSTSPYKGEIVSFSGKVLSTFEFDPSIVKGRISVKGPYFADASKANFYSEVGQFLVAINVSESSFCNDDSVCNEDVGENFDNCPTDCRLRPPSISPTPEVPAGDGEGTNKWTSAIAYLMVGIAIAVLVWVIRRLRKKNSAGLTPM